MARAVPRHSSRLQSPGHTAYADVRLVVLYADRHLVWEGHEEHRRLTVLCHRGSGSDDGLRDDMRPARWRLEIKVNAVDDVKRWLRRHAHPPTRAVG